MPTAGLNKNAAEHYDLTTKWTMQTAPSQTSIDFPQSNCSSVAKKKRIEPVRKPPNPTASAIQTTSHLINELITSLLDIKATLITEVMRKSGRACRKQKQHAKLERKLIQVQKMLNTTQTHSDTEVDNLLKRSNSLQNIKPEDYEKLSQLQKNVEETRNYAAQQVELAVTLIAPQLLQLVAALKQPIETTHEKLRILSTTSQLILSIGGDASTVTRQATAYDPVSQKWTPVCSMHARRYRAAATSWNGKVVVAGGWTEESHYDKTVEEYDPVSNSWSFLSNLLVGRCEHALVTVNDRIFALGGQTGPLIQSSSVETLDKEGTQWTNAQPMIFSRTGFIAVALRSNIIVAGGEYDKCEKFNMDVNQWSLIASLNIPRTNAAAAAHLDSVYVFGGWNLKLKYLESIEQYDVLTDSWTVLQAKLTVARSYLAAAYLDNCIYLFGGSNEENLNKAGRASECFNLTKLQFTVLQPLQAHLQAMAAASVVVTAEQMPAIAHHPFILYLGGQREHYLNSVEAYVPANDKWYTLSQMQTARIAESATSWNNTVAVAGGWPECNLRSVQQYDLLSNTWTNMPPLIQARYNFALVNLDGTLLAVMLPVPG